jgi:hypothetical protein
VPARAQDSVPDSSARATASETAAGQGLIYGGRFDAASLYFSRLAERYPRDPVGPALGASTLIWWGAAQQNDGFDEDSIEALLAEATARAERAVAAAETDSARVVGLLWLGTSTGYRARQAELHGHYWRAAREARKMRAALNRAVALDSSCVDCLLGLAIYDYALARAGALARLVARIIGLGGGDAPRALQRMRRVSESGSVARLEAQWVYANALLRESAPGGSLREESRRIVSALAERFPENPVFRRFLDSTVSSR